MSKKKESLHQKVIKIQSSIQNVHKDTKGYNYKYASLSEIQKLIREHIIENELGVTNTVHPPSFEDASSYNGTLQTVLFDGYGDMIKCDCPLIDAKNLLSNGNAMQGMGTAITYARRYNLLNIFNLIPTEDDDAASLTPKNKTKPIPQMILPAQKSEIIALHAEVIDKGIPLDADKFNEKVGDMTKLTFQDAKSIIDGLNKKLKGNK